MCMARWGIPGTGGLVKDEIEEDAKSQGSHHGVSSDGKCLECTWKYRLTVGWRGGVFECVWLRGEFHGQVDW